MNNCDMAVPNKIKALRRDAGLTQQQLGDRIGAAHSIIGKLENGKQDLTDEYMLKICNVLHCTPNDLMGFSRPQPALNAEAMAYAINLAFEVVGDLHDADPLEYVADAALHVYDLILKDGIFQAQEPRRTKLAMMALKEHLDLEQEQRTASE